MGDRVRQYNFASKGDGGQAGKIISQLYFRQAMQDLVDQPLYVKEHLQGLRVANPTDSVPVLPASQFATSYEENDPYPYSVAQRARLLLTAHGWNIVPNGTDSCQVASKCGVPKGTKLNLTMSLRDR